MRLLKWQLLFLAILTFGTGSYFYRRRTSLIPTGEFYMAGCQIFNSELDIVKSLPPAYICLPTSDGGWLSADTEKLVRHAADGHTQWERAGFYSHRLQLLNETSVLVLLTEYHDYKNEKVRFEIVQKLDDRTGNVQAEFSLYKNLFLASMDSSYKTLTDSGEIAVLNRGVKREASHLNAFSVNLDFIFVGDSHRPSLVLDHNLKFRGFNDSLEKNLQLGMRFQDMKHDIQFNNNESLVFLNHATDASSRLKTFKVIEFRDNQKIFEFPEKPADFIETSCCGGVEKLGVNYLVGFRAKDRISSVIGIVSGDKRWLIKKTIPMQIQEIKRIPYPDYLQLNQASE